MGLDWCLKDKPKTGLEEEFEAARDAYERAEEEVGYDTPAYRERKAAWAAVTVSPHETLGVPRIGMDQAATRYLLEEIAPSHRKHIEEQHLDPATDKYAAHWLQTDEALLLAEHHGEYTPELVDEYHTISTVTAYGPFRAMAGAFSFRGKIIGYSPLLTEELQNRAYEDMTPPEMAEYAGRIEEEAFTQARQQHGGLDLLAGRINGSLAPALRVWAEDTIAHAEQQAEDDGAIEDELMGFAYPKGHPKNSGHFSEYEFNEEASLAYRLRSILDAARWLRFWADLGHGMHAWS